VEDPDYYKGEIVQYSFDDSCAHMVRDNNKCIVCRRCVAACDAQGISVIGANARGFDTHISSPFDKDLSSVSCISCGQCIVNCPTAAIVEKDETAKVFNAINDASKHVVVTVAPSIRVTLGEAFGQHIGTNVQGRMVAALRRLGFDKVFDLNFAADLTIMEEAHEIIDRVQNNGVLPIISSCSPGWVKYCEHYYPELIAHLSSCKSPQQMHGAIIKSWYAQQAGIAPENIFVVSIIPCTAKKFEVQRDDQNAVNGLPDVDVALTTRELARMIESAGIYFKTLPEEAFDSPMGEASSAGLIFGATGGVCEAALRTASEALTGKALEAVDFSEVRGTEGVKEATYKLGGIDFKVAVVSGTKNAKVIMDKIRAGEADYHFVEVMGCPGGCVNGGGQPIQHAVVHSFRDLKTERARALYTADLNAPVRKSHENPDIIKLYDDFLGEPGGKKAHDLLHTSYVTRPKYQP
jgi:NADP-reducing hydrogenase subunit HndD